MALLPQIVAISGTPCAVILADLVEAPLDARLESAAVFEVDVRDPELLDNDRFDAARRRYSIELAWDETTLAPKSLTHARSDEGYRTRVRLAASSYAAFKAAREQIVDLDFETRISLLTRAGLGAPASFSHTFGVNCTLETSDGKMLLVRRGIANEATTGQLSVAMSENSNIDDVVDNTFDPLDTAIRGFDEELGLSPDDLGAPELGIAPVTFNAIIAQVPDCAISVVGHAVTHLSVDEVLEKQRGAKDAHESGGFEVCEFSPDAITELLSSDLQWTSWTPAALLGAIRVRFGTDIAASVYEQVLTARPAAV